jgi:hypothetical protein
LHSISHFNDAYTQNCIPNWNEINADEYGLMAERDKEETGNFCDQWFIYINEEIFANVNEIFCLLEADRTGNLRNIKNKIQYFHDIESKIQQAVVLLCDLFNLLVGY